MADKGLEERVAKLEEYIFKMTHEQEGVRQYSMQRIRAELEKRLLKMDSSDG